MAGSVFQMQRRVEFRDTDAAGIVHFSVFFAYMEEAEHALLRQAGLSVVSEINGQTVSWPRVAAQCDFQQAIRFEQLVTIDVSISRLGRKSITWAFRFHRDDVTLAEGSITTVCCQISHGDIRADHKPVSIEIPQIFRERLEPYLV